MKVNDLELYVNKCPVCDDWRDYKYIGKFKEYLVFRCPNCGLVMLKELSDFEKE